MTKKIEDGGSADVDDIFLFNPAKHHRDRAAYWERVAAKARTEGDAWYEAYSKGKAAAERQKAREIEAESEA